MAGIYIHIPFCKSRCIYCDFFSSTFLREKEYYIDDLCTELATRKDYLGKETINTIYFGGGTPSLLTPFDFDKLFTKLNNLFSINWQNTEITLEVNPDDLSEGYIKDLKQFPFNRMSIGIQSFNNTELKFLNRRHNSQNAIESIKKCQDTGYDNISIDLMYGLPLQSIKSWIETIKKSISLQVQHISAYHLIYEEGTSLYKLLSSGAINPIDEEASIEMFESLILLLRNAGFKQYEISNFAQEGFQSKHNSSYWNGTPYLGIGAAAHSYNGISRQWNKHIIIKSYLNYEPEIEFIDNKTAFNDFIITRLRTMKGIDLHELESSWGKMFKDYTLKQAQKYLTKGLLELYEGYLRLTPKGIFISDGIMSDLMK